jgi:hypothetical protein
MKLSRLDPPAAGVAGARERLCGLFPDGDHKRIVLLFGEEQSMPGTAAWEHSICPTTNRIQSRGARFGGWPARRILLPCRPRLEASRRVGFLREGGS